MTGDLANPVAPDGRMPAIYLGHGAPPLFEDREWLAQLGAWGRAIARPKSILVLSAHWDAKPAAIGATEKTPLVYDFYGFPEKYYRFEYASPGAPSLAARVRELLSA